MWATTMDAPSGWSHPLHRRLNQLLREHGFDDIVETQCADFEAEAMGRRFRIALLTTALLECLVPAGCRREGLSP